MTGNTIRKGFRVQDAQLDGLLEELVRRINSGEVTAQTVISRVASVESEPTPEILDDATADGSIYGRKDVAWALITPAGIGASASDHTHDLSDLAKLTSALNAFTYSQTVGPQQLTSSSGVVAWNLNAKQNAELSTSETVTSWTVSNGAAGRFYSLRLSVTGEHTITWTDTIFKNMADFALPDSGKVSVLSFRGRTAGVLEFLGQSPAFDEWAP